MKKFIVVSCEHCEKTEVPHLCATFNTRPAAEDYIENAILKSLDEFKSLLIKERNVLFDKECEYFSF